jgi:arginyl-tRNA--protein-N-Asp/Glu arginylyltransferase
MQELFRILEDPRECSYLPDVLATLQISLISSMTPEEHGGQMERGYRRFGMQVFRPACGACIECRSMRIPVQEFSPTGSQRRVLRQNRHIRAELHTAYVTAGHVELFNVYHQFMGGHRGWPVQHVDAETYHRDFVLDPARTGRQWLYFDEENGDKLVGVALMDEVPGAISLVYFYYDPAWRGQSPGTFSILNQLLYAKAAGLEYAYFGYWVKGCQSLAYKSRFTPHEILLGLPADDEPAVWVRAMV